MKMMDIIDPRTIPAWDALLLRSGNPSFFCSCAWAAVLAEAYRYKPVYFAAFDDNAFSLVMPVMEIRSPLTGKRGVSLPFTDHCEPFAREDGLLQEAADRVLEYGREAKWRYVEWRNGGSFTAGAPACETYVTHDLPLRENESELFSKLKESNRRNIRKAVREGVSVSIGRDRDSLKSFYRLNCLTRQRHGIPPQPFAFFEKVFEHVISKGLGIIACAAQAGRIIAASMFFLFGNRAIFKYGASDIARQELRPNNLLMWEVIRWLKKNGYSRLNLGRTEPENEGLLRYKRAWGAAETPLDYHRFSYENEGFIVGHRKPHPGRRNLLSRIPLVLSRLVGRLAYRHVG